MHASGRSLTEIQRTLGHSMFVLTSDTTYTSVFPEVDATAAERAAAVVPRAVGGTPEHTLSTPAASAGGAVKKTRKSNCGPRGTRT
jgi:hypothetical protein